MKYCRTCITPDSRPNVTFDHTGECSSCRNARIKKEIDWDDRARQLAQVVSKAKERSKGYDCLIPVSGGKDSTWQVIQCRNLGLNPLAVTWKTPARTELGRKNLENLVSLGVDHIDYQVSPQVERKFMLAAYERFGSTALPMHMALFNIPLTLAVRFSIPLVVWGENSAFEYGNDADAERGFRLDSAWLKKYGVTHGTVWQDWVGPSLSEKELTPYRGPSDQELEAAGVNAVFLGYYLRWDPAETYRIAKEHGFQEDKSGPRTGYYAYADIDDDFISLHHFLKWHKFGFTRAFDNLSIEIRQGRINREEAIATLKRLGDQTPHADIKRFCAFAGIPETRFFEIAEKFRNKKIWKQVSGKWMIPDFLIHDWEW
jgi:N-acetyl sugar amidotransferase